MPLETSLNSIADLNPAWPTAADPKSDGDDHIRGLKYIFRITFPLFTGPMPIANDQVASKDYCNQLAFNTVLPAQPGGALSYAMTSLNGIATWKRSDIFSDIERTAQTQATALSL